MKRKTGIVIKVFKNYVSIKTINKEIFNVKIKDYTPNVGDIYSGNVTYQNSKVLKRFIALAIILLSVAFCRNIYKYNETKAVVTIHIPPTIQLKVNNYNRVVKASATKKVGRNLLTGLKLKNLPLNNALEKIIDTAKEKDILNDKYLQNKNNTIIIYTSTNNESMDLSSFKKYLSDRNLKYKINYDGSDIIN